MINSSFDESKNNFLSIKRESSNIKTHREGKKMSFSGKYIAKMSKNFFGK